MDTFDPSRPISITNWPAGLRLPPLKTAPPKPEKPSKPETQKPNPEAEQAPWWSCD